MMLHISKLLDELSDLRLGVQGHESNEHLLSRVSDVADALSAYICDDSSERALLSEFQRVHESLRRDHEAALEAENIKIEKLRKELHDLQADRDRLAEEVTNLKNVHFASAAAGEDVIAGQRQTQELKERLRQLQHTRDQLLTEADSWRHKLELLEEKAELHRSSQNDILQRDKLLYEFISSSLNIAIVNRKGSQVDLALLSESEDRSEQTWHCLTVGLEECDQSTTDYLWSAIEKSFEREAMEPPSNSSIETFRLGH